MFPTMEITRTEGHEASSPTIPYGIENRNSPMGIVAAPSTSRASKKSMLEAGGSGYLIRNSV